MGNRKRKRSERVAINNRKLNTAAAAEATETTDMQSAAGTAASSSEGRSVSSNATSFQSKCILRCQEDNGTILWWHSPAAYVPLQLEESMIGVLLKWKQRERGMMRDQPHFRLQQVRRMCKAKQVRISLALSLRRHHMQRLNPYCGTTALRLGSEADIRESARKFEVCVGEFLDRQQVEYWDETEQNNHTRTHLQPEDIRPPTPDFLLKRKLTVKRYTVDKDGNKQVLSEMLVNWIEAKMYYGASTIPHNNKSAVGNLLSTAKKYNKFFGPGAMVFMHGCGDRLAAELLQEGVIVLDCSSDETVSLEAVYVHQRTWCANEYGQILP